MQQRAKPWDCCSGVAFRAICFCQERAELQQLLDELKFLSPPPESPLSRAWWHLERKRAEAARVGVYESCLCPWCQCEFSVSELRDFKAAGMHDNFRSVMGDAFNVTRPGIMISFF